MTGHRLLLCAVLVYLTLDLALPMMPGAFEFATCIDSTRESRNLSTDGAVVRPELATDRAEPRPLAVAAPAAVATRHVRLPRPVALRRPRARLARATLDVGTPPAPLASR